MIGGEIHLPEIECMGAVGVAVGIQFCDDVDHAGVTVEAEIACILAVDRSDSGGLR